MSQQWREKTRPACLERQYRFDNYEELRNFLDAAAELSEKEGYYPDMGFGRDYLNVTIHAEEGKDEITDVQRKFAGMLDDLGGYKETD
jgi:pterin-4a-carbinolamine dehydratase